MVNKTDKVLVIVEITSKGRETVSKLGEEVNKKKTIFDDGKCYEEKHGILLENGWLEMKNYYKFCHYRRFH